MKTLFVAGTFDKENGKVSSVMQDLYHGLYPLSPWLNESRCINGGNLSVIEDLVNKEEFKNYPLVFWFPNISNDEEKLVQKIKQMNPSCLLVTSKRNLAQEYSFPNLIQKALYNKSNLFVEIRKHLDKYEGRVLDPLGNCYVDNSFEYCDGFNDDFFNLGKVIALRILELKKTKRVKSEQLPLYGKPLCVPEDKDFLNGAVKMAGVFSRLIPHPTENLRFLGNASFRCSYGFPSFRSDNDVVYVSKRNVDKCEVQSTDGFIPVSFINGMVQYFGENKPSVDSPIQLLLYNYYRNAKYMIHGHVYVKNAPFTTKVIPCGDLREVDEIKQMFPYPEINSFAINLKGHGCFIMTDGKQADIKDLHRIFECVARPMPEIQKF